MYPHIRGIDAAHANETPQLLDGGILGTSILWCWWITKYLQYKSWMFRLSKALGGLR